LRLEGGQRQAGQGAHRPHQVAVGLVGVIHHGSDACSLCVEASNLCASAPPAPGVVAQRLRQRGA
jgi:hypothetical protein